MDRKLLNEKAKSWKDFMFCLKIYTTVYDSFSAEFQWK